MNKRIWKLITQILITLAVSGLALGVYTDLKLRYQPILLQGGEMPQSLLVAVVFTLGVAIAALVEIWLPHLFHPIIRLKNKLGVGRYVLALLAAFAVSYLFLYTKWSTVYSGTYIRTLVYLAFLGGMAWLATSSSGRSFTWGGLLTAGVLLGSVFTLANALQTVVSYPLTLSWSEGNRLWDYSVLYGRQLYDYPAGQTIPAYIDRGRQSLWGLPWLFGNVSILTARLWSAFLFTIPYAILGWFVFKPQKGRLGLWLLLGLWTMLFLAQGPIYTPLVLAAILVAASRRTPLWLGVFLVGMAGYYANFSRYTWIFAPAMWAGMLAFIETNPVGVKKDWQRWGRAIGLGLSGVLGGYVLPQAVSAIQATLAGVKPEPGLLSPEGISGAVSRQPLLWERLWPNPTFGPGIVLGLLMAAGPLVALILLYGLRKRWLLNLWQKLVIWGVLLAFLVVGLIVSVKIGGGGNLHNMDMLLIGLLFIAGLAWEAGLGDWVKSINLQAWWRTVLMLGVVLIPASQGMMTAALLDIPPQEKMEEALQAIQTYTNREKDNGDVLFIDQRQLLTFGYVTDLPLVADYEKKYMMDQAMAENMDYFSVFYKDLAAHRFSVIVVEPLWIMYQGGTYQFGNENDAWVRFVSVPVLCYYQPAETFMDAGVQILIPKEKSSPEPGVVCPEY